MGTNCMEKIFDMADYIFVPIIGRYALWLNVQVAANDFFSEIFLRKSLDIVLKCNFLLSETS